VLLRVAEAPWYNGSSYSPDLASSRYHLFGTLKETLKGHRFTSDQEVQAVAHARLAAQP
jgi:hypothetical protein